jgi:hypothetical protein
MKLPTIETPSFELVLPSSGKPVKYRPYLVKEEKILFIALESGEPASILTAMQEVVDACTFNKLNMNALTSFDLEYIFLQLRIKSVGESVTLNLKCERDGEFTPVTVDLTAVKLVQSASYEPTKNIRITDKIGMIMKPVSLQSLLQMESKESSGVEALTDRIIGCIDYIYDTEKTYYVADVSREEIRNFVDSLSHSHLESIREYITSFPRLEHTVKFKCFKCGHENTVVLSGIQSFFG